MLRVLSFVALLLVICLAPPAAAQYPRVPKTVARQARAKTDAMQQRSDEAWAKALPIIKQWEAKGKPYVPSAAKPDDLAQAAIPAFPGAQGGGMYSHGGRGGRVFVVTNLNDRGPGSFREACEAGGPRIVVFNVAGIIQLEERLLIRAPYITIDGSRAPGHGVCIAGDTVELETHDVVIRHMRFRRGATGVGDRNDSLGGNPIGNIMIDHVSASWGLDENLSMYRHMYQPPDGTKQLKLPTVNITIQNSIFSEALDTYNHAFGSTLGGRNATFHRNLWACNTGRNPSVGMIYDFTFTNNVLFNWRHRTIDGGDHRSFYTIVNNYLKPGPVTDRRKPVSYRFLKPESRRSQTFNTDFGKAYVAGNVAEGNDRVTADNWDGGVQVDESEGYDLQTVISQLRADHPYPHAHLEILPAREAYEYVLENAGATLPVRDAVDQRVIAMVRTGEVTTPHTKGIIKDVAEVGGYPRYQGEPYDDADHDGMADEWERRHGLNPNDAADATQVSTEGGYTNIECFLYRVDPNDQPEMETPRTYRDLFGDDPEKAAVFQRNAARVWTTQEDHQNMLEQLGIEQLRPGPSADPNAPNAANYDEAKATPFSSLPELLRLQSGEQVTRPEQWWDERRPEIIEAFEREIYGRVPENVPPVRWDVRQTRNGMAGDVATVEKHIVGTVDNSDCPEIEVHISMSLTLPKDANQPVPVLMMFGWTPFDPLPPWLQRFRNRPGPKPHDQLIQAGWGVAKLNPNSVQDDRGGFQTLGPHRDQPKRGMGLTRGIIGLTNRGQPREPDQWGALRAWAWGASRGLDYLETEPLVNGRRVGIEGVSRYGKAALLTMAFDQRFAMALIGSSGKGGTTLYRRNFGEAVETLASSGEYHWMAGNFLKYAAQKSRFGQMDARDLSVDTHQLIALCAPRLTFISYGVPEKGDAKWLDQHGSYMAAIAAQPVFRLLGAKGLGRSDDFWREAMPAVNEGLLDGQLAWRQHDGGHTDVPNIKHFIHWVEMHWERQ